MIDSDKRRFADTLQATYTEIYQRDALTTNALRIWWGAFEHVSIDDFSAALSKWITTPGRGQFPPKPADILEMIGGTAQDRATLAWHQVRAAAARLGGYTSVCFDDPLINLTIEQMGGWPRLCATPEAEQPFRAKDFERTYAAHAVLPAQHPASLPGIIETQNAASGRVRPCPPALVGDSTRAARVFASGRSGPALAVLTASLPAPLIPETPSC